MARGKYNVFRKVFSTGGRQLVVIHQSLEYCRGYVYGASQATDDNIPGYEIRSTRKDGGYVIVHETFPVICNPLSDPA